MDFDKALGATYREVSNGVRDGMRTHIVRASRTYLTTPDNLWSALTEKPRISRWFGEVVGDFRLGGRYAVTGNADGEITVCVPPHSLALTWEFGGTMSWVAVKIEETNDGAQLTLEHELPTDEKSEAHWKKFGPGATGVGWDMGIWGLDMHLSSDGEQSNEAGAAWAGSAQGKTSLRLWAHEWGAAHVSAGIPAQTAKEMARRTAAFYTGEE